MCSAWQYFSEYIQKFSSKTHMRHSRTILLFSEEFTEDCFLHTIKNSPEKQSHHIWTLAHNLAPRQHF